MLAVMMMRRSISDVAIFSLKAERKKELKIILYSIPATLTKTILTCACNF